MSISPIIHINGFPGIGKLTIARRLVDILSKRRSPSDSAAVAKLIHNHLLIDPAGAVLDRTQPGYQELRQAIRSTIFKTLIGNSATHETTYIFTDFQSGDESGSAVCREYRSLAAARGCTFIPILLTCAEKENLERLASPDRALHDKLTDIDLVRQFRRKAASAHKFVDEIAWLELDITKLSPDEAAGILAAHVEKFMTVHE